MDNPWELYDELIDGIPVDLIVDDYSIGLGWTQVYSNNMTGVAMTVKDRGPKMFKGKSLKGQSLKKVASLVKSWDYIEASIGTAALNCYYNTPDKIQDLDGFKGMNLDELTEKDRRKKEAFIAFRDEIEGKNVAVIGHFPHLIQELGPICNLSILERNPRGSDYPDPACEYILKDQDYIFITGMTFTNKTLPRLLEVCRGYGKVSIVGPSICMSSKLFDWGVNNISGFCVLDREILNEVVAGGEKSTIFRSGVMASIGEE